MQLVGVKAESREGTEDGKTLYPGRWPPQDKVMYQQHEQLS
jgi:hypothetical protein